MSQNTDHLRTAGKITVYTTLLGVFVFGLVFLLNLGTNEIPHVVAQQIATTSVTVLNTAPVWTATTTELIESSSDNPTNAGDVVTWVAVGTDANAEDYYLLICDGNATPTPNSNAAPDCDPGDVQWGVSTATLSGTQASVSTTTADAWAESNVWYGWVCDGNNGTPRCNSIATQGTNATNSSPFEVNHRPSFTILSDNSPKDPGQTVTFTSTSSDTDSSGTQDTVRLFVCSTNSFSTTTDTCNATTLASTTIAAAALADASSTYTIVIPTQDQDYNAYGFVIDNHGFEATGGAQGTDSTLTVANVAPTVSSSTIVINDGLDMTLTEEASQTPAFTLQFTIDDNNTCDAVGGGLGDEIVDFNLSLYRSGVGSTTCSVTGPYNANNCYPSSEAPTAWALSCTASSTSCTGGTDTDVVWDCTFPLWYVADPTDGTATSTQYPTQNWLAQVQGIDDDAATGATSQSETGVEVVSFLAFALNTLTISYGSLEPGQQNDPLTATTTIASTGNVGLDKDVQGESMCTTYSTGSPCPTSATSTIPESEQHFSTSTVTYAQGTALSSTTPQEIEVNVPKSTATSTQATSDAYWGIRVPATISFSGDYTGENTITALVGESVDW